MSSRPLPTRRQAIFACAFAALTVLTCAGLVSAAVLVPAPPVVVPFLVVTCMGCAMLATLELPVAVAVLRAARTRGWTRDARLLADMRRDLRRLPETQHPLDL
jgi:hypothetical protein